jgi:Cu/Ag efflux protein CusF
MKTSLLMKSVVALAIGAALPVGAMAAPPAKTMTERGVIEKVDDARKEFALKGGTLKRSANFEWNESTRILENGKPVPASNLKMGEHATVNYAKQGKQLVASSIAISPNGKAAQTHKSHKPAHS